MNINIYNKHCCGCGECVSVCPTKAITMKTNAEGFSYPSVMDELCKDCSLCVTSCSFNEGEKNCKCNNVREAYAVKHYDNNVRMESRSGGIFTALSDWIFEQGGVVYGCQLEDFTKAIHVRTVNQEERDKLRGSKYIQSDISATFEQVKFDLLNGLWVLYSGTPCQLNAIKDYCKKICCDKLLLVDIVCHGVPSQQVWKDYLEYLSAKFKSKVSNVEFRDKKRFGWASHRETVSFESGEEQSDNVFTKLFYSHLILRKDCFECPYKNLNRVGDITIADCWGIRDHYPEFDDNKGVSLVLLNSNMGMEVFSKVNSIESIKVDVSKLIQPPLKENWDFPTGYKKFWRYYHKKRFEKVLDKYVLESEGWIDWIKWTCLGIAKKVGRILNWKR